MKMLKMLKMCLNWKVIAALVAVGVGLYAVAPELAIAALPFLVLAICPLSMMFMMNGMQNGQDGEQQASEEKEAEPTRDERVTRLREERADLDRKIGALDGEQARLFRSDDGGESWEARN